ncbi:MAG: orotidine-5'-phosphate decarboxylase [Proteobacteria bacterium]|nr:orotidine-5'-phosphate decarboxylase [Pseudomonadota bacterium]
MFSKKLDHIWQKNNSLVCVGLDPELSKIPQFLHSEKYPIFEFNKQIIDATADLVCAYKPQIAFYSSSGAEDQMKMTIDYIKERASDVPVILDSKRGDIGNTAKMYAEEAFVRYQADAVTVNPFLGLDSMQPFLDYADKGVIILCRTSNPGAKDIQDLDIKGKKLYQVIAEKAQNEWNYNKNISLVVGATYPEEVKELRAIAKDITFLIPGVGAQGGDVKAVVQNGCNEKKTGIVVSSSRGIIFAGSDKNFAEASRKAALQLRDEINLYR